MQIDSLKITDRCLIHRCPWTSLQTTKVSASPKEDPPRRPGLLHILRPVPDETPVHDQTPVPDETPAPEETPALDDTPAPDPHPEPP